MPAGLDPELSPDPVQHDNCTKSTDDGKRCKAGTCWCGCGTTPGHECRRYLNYLVLRDIDRCRPVVIPGKFHIYDMCSRGYVIDRDRGDPPELVIDINLPAGGCRAGNDRSGCLI